MPVHRKLLALPFLLVLLGCLLAQACVGNEVEVPKPMAVERPTPSEEEKRRAVEEEKRRTAEKEEQRALKRELVLRAGEASGGELPEFAVVQIMYATDRKATGKEDEAYGSDRGNLQLGICAVGLLRDRRKAPLDIHPMVKAKSREDFFWNLRDRLAESKQNEVIVFVHGYNVTFEEAAGRTAQIAFDLGFTGVPILYSWPSQGKLAGYLVDETNVEWTVPHLKDFLAQLVGRSGAQTVHLVAHSMGNRAVTAALRQMGQEQQGTELPRFRELVLLAPDMDADIFANLVPEIKKTVERVTLYASSRDKTLAWSKTVHGYPRAGDTKPTVVVVPGVDIIDASLVDTSFSGHSYYADSKSVLFDLFNLLRHGKPPDERFGLIPREQNGLRYWEFQP